MSKQLNLGIIGAGRIARIHAQNLTWHVPGARVLAICDIVEEAAQQCARDFGIPAAYSDHRQILEDDRIEAVMICSATETHAQFMEESAGAGKHIFCEKPIDRNLARIDEALAAVNAAGVKLQVGFQRRFDPSLRRVHDLVADGKIGEPQVVRIFSREPEPPPLSYMEISGGMFLDSTIHDFDMARFLIQDEIDEVFAAGRVVTDPRIADVGDIDSAIVVLRYRGGALGVIDNSRLSGFEGYDQRVEVSGSQGWVRSENDKVDTTQLTTAAGEQRALPPFSFIERYSEAYIIEMRDFVQAMLDDRTPAVTGWDGRMPVLAAYAAKKSYEENRPVKLSEVDTELNDNSASV